MMEVLLQIILQKNTTRSSSLNPQGREEGVHQRQIHRPQVHQADGCHGDGPGGGGVRRGALPGPAVTHQAVRRGGGATGAAARRREGVAAGANAVLARILC